MFKDIDQTLAAVARWSADYPILGFIAMGFMGGLVAVLILYQKAGIAFTWPSFIGRCAARTFIGMFLAAGVFFAWRTAGFSADWGFIVAGICGMGGADIAEALVVILIEKLKQRAGSLIPGRDKPADSK